MTSKLIPYSISFEQNEAEMSLTEHLEEVRQRAFWSLSLLVTTVLGCLVTVKSIAVIELVCSPVCYLVELVLRFEYVIVAIELITWKLFPLH